MRIRDIPSISGGFLTRSRLRRNFPDLSLFSSANLVMWQRAGTGGGAGAVWPDMSGNANDLNHELSGGTTWVQDSPGLVVNVNGTQGLMTAAHNAGLSITGELTLSCYIKFGALLGAAKYPYLIGKGTSATNGYILLWHGDDQRVEFYTGNGTSIIVKDTTLPVVGQWHHFAGVITAAGASRVTRFYRDGRQVAETSMANIAIGTNTDSILCGKHPDGLTYGFLNAQYGGVTLHNRALTAGEIMNLFNLMRSW